MNIYIKWNQKEKIHLVNNEEIPFIKSISLVKPNNTNITVINNNLITEFSRNDIDKEYKISKYKILDNKKYVYIGLIHETGKIFRGEVTKLNEGCIVAEGFNIINPTSIYISSSLNEVLKYIKKNIELCHASNDNDCGCTSEVLYLLKKNKNANLTGMHCKNGGYIEIHKIKILSE
jgi:hypothetical protein